MLVEMFWKTQNNIIKKTDITLVWVSRQNWIVLCKRPEEDKINKPLEEE